MIHGRNLPHPSVLCEIFEHGEAWWNDVRFQVLTAASMKL